MLGDRPLHLHRHPDKRTRNTPITTNTGEQRGARRPSADGAAHDGGAGDCAAELGDELEPFKKNLAYGARRSPGLDVAAGLIDWKKK